MPPTSRALSDGIRILITIGDDMAHQPQCDARGVSTLVPMLIWGLILIVVGMASVMVFV